MNVSRVQCRVGRLMRAHKAWERASRLSSAPRGAGFGVTSNRDTSTVIIAVVIAGSTTRCDVKGGRGGEVRYAGVPRFGFAHCASAERGDFSCAPVAAQDSRNACERTVRLALGSSLLHRRARATSSRELEDSRELQSGPTFTPRPAVEAQERRGRFRRESSSP